MDAVEKAKGVREAIFSSLDQMAVTVAGAMGPQFLEAIQMHQRAIAAEAMMQVESELGIQDRDAHVSLKLFSGAFQSIEGKMSDADRATFRAEMDRLKLEEIIPQSVRKGYAQAFEVKPASKGCLLLFLW
jgi:hypothetical protein